MTDSLRKAFGEFWDDQLRIEETPQGLVLALPMMLSDGWQVVLHLEKLTPTKWLLSDNGEILGKLSESGVNFQQGKLLSVLEAQSRFYGFEQNGLQLQRVVDFPFNPADMQIFAEALVGLSHLLPKVFKEIKISTERLIEDRVSSFFYNHKLEPKRRYKLEGLVEKEIVVEYYLENNFRLALQPVHRSANLLPFMERWGWRWTDLRHKDPEIKRAMLFDPDNQDWDEASLNIGDSVCDIFVPYTETEEVLGRMLMA